MDKARLKSCRCQKMSCACAALVLPVGPVLMRLLEPLELLVLLVGFVTQICNCL